MLFVLSPAKNLNERTPAPTAQHTQPALLGEAEKLMAQLRPLAPQDLAALMHVSDKIALLNAERNAAWHTPFTLENAKQAVYLFNGDVYEGLDAESLPEAAIDYLQQHLRLLSGLYGLLRPLDLMQPYRLEMGTRLATDAGTNLYQFWGARIAEHLNRQLADDTDPVVVNLASQEYFKAVDRKALSARVVECVFEDGKGGAYKIISFYAKRARGLMARWAIQQRASTPRQLEGFDLEGYAFHPAASSPERLVFRRAAQP